MSNKPHGVWPKEIIICLSCGRPSYTGRDWVGPCSGDDPMHSPTQTVPVVPASVAEELAEALEPFAGCQITDDGEPPAADYDWPPMTERIVDWLGRDDFSRTRTALTAYHAALGKGAE